MHRRRHFREKRSHHFERALLAVMMYSVVFVDHNLVDDGTGNYYDNDEDIVGLRSNG